MAVAMAWMTVFPNSPHLSSRTFFSSSVKGLVFWESMWPAVLGTAVSHPPPQQPPSESWGSQPAPVTTGSHYPIPAFWPGCWHLPICPLFHTRNQPRVSSLGSSCPVQPPDTESQPMCLWMSPGVFQHSRCGSSHDQQHRNHWSQVNCFLLITNNLVFPVPFWSHALFSDVEQSYTDL